MKLLCKLVTNPLKPTACTHPINLCNSLGSGLSDLHHCIACGRGPWLKPVINFPFLPVALSWRPSLFLLGDSDIGHNRHKQNLVCTRTRKKGAVTPQVIQSFPGVSRSLWLRHVLVVTCCWVAGNECCSSCMGTFEEVHHYLHYIHHSLAPGKQQRGNTAPPLD